MSRLFWLSDEAWAAIEPQRPKNEGFSESLDVIRPVVGNARVNSSENSFLKHRFRKAPYHLSFRRVIPALLAVCTDRVYC